MTITRRDFMKGAALLLATGCAAESADILGGKVVSNPDRQFADHDHAGLDYNVAMGTPIVAAANGLFLQNLDEQKGLSRGAIWIWHPTDVCTVYGHLSERRMNLRMQPVFRGQVIGYSGQTGTPWLHLHFEVDVGKIPNAKPVNPYNGFWATGKPRTYDGVTDYDKELREKRGKIQLSAPFIGSVPHGNVNLERIVATANTSEIAKYSDKPEEFVVPLFETSLALLYGKYKPLAKELVGIPILNDSITKEEALSVYKLYKAIEDVNFEQENMPKEHAIKIKAIKDVTQALVGERWNFYLQEMIRYGQEKDILEPLQTYTSLRLLLRDIWGKGTF